VNTLLADPDRAREFGEAGRRRAVESFAWPAIAQETSQLYRSLT
jgi:starch synthase